MRAARALQKRQRLADNFKVNARLEELIQLRKRSPDQFDALPAPQRISVGHYEDAKAAAKEMGRDNA